ncbi:MAG: N-acetylmuramoyl-L-alanine amidase, partial [Acetatifactor sp.]|nr:N-acetylmuramoyl-L-alanine amidase [Acetatifactor sp.]
VVIDPGHGGSNEGTTENGFCEKEMTLTTALALYDRLTQYDGVTVYLTRTDDTESSLADRAMFAKSVGADYLFSIHYNASETHELFGSEVWVPLTAPYNVYGYQFGCTLLSRLQEKGLFIRGIKTRKNDRGTDYYGILRESVALEIPAILIEHCHVDEVRDYPYCDTKEKQEAFGYEDAEAIARFLGLSSESLGIDYSGEPEDPFLQKVYAMDTDTVVASTLQDTTAPEICSIERISEDYEGLEAVIQVSAADYDSPLIYYAYSLDGGLTYSPRQPWPGSNTLTGEYQDVFQVALEIPEETMPRICVKAYNQFEITTESNVLEGYMIFRRPQEEVPESVETLGTAADASEESPESQPASAGGWLDSRGEPEAESPEYAVRIQDFLLVSLLAAAARVALMLVIQILRSAAQHRRRHRRK